MLKHTLATLLFYVILISPLFAQTGWQRITVPTNDWTLDVNNMSFMNSYFWGRDSGFVNKSVSTNGGGSWIHVDLPWIESLSHDNIMYGRLDFFAKNLDYMYMVGTSLTKQGPDYFPYYSSNPILQCYIRGDSQWRSNPSFNEVAGGCNGAQRICFVNDRQGYIFNGSRSCGDFVGDIFGPPRVLITVDSGVSWRRVASLETYNDFHEMVFINDTVLIVTLDTLVIRVDVSLDEEVADNITIISTGYISGGSSREYAMLYRSLDSNIFLERGSRLLRSTDDGLSWHLILDSCRILSMTSANHSTIYATGEKNSMSWIFKSNDNGSTWIPQLATSGTTFRSISAPSDSVAYAFGTNGIGYKTTDGGGTTLSAFNKTGDNSEQLSVFPNPTSNTIHVSFNEYSIDRIAQVYDGLGREVIRMPVVTDSGNLEIPVSILPNGIYYLVLGTETAQFIVQK